MNKILQRLKKVWKSKVMVFNLLSAVVYVSTSLTGQQIMSDQVLLVITVLGNAVLRLYTTNDLKDK